MKYSTTCATDLWIWFQKLEAIIKVSMRAFPDYYRKTCSYCVMYCHNNSINESIFLLVPGDNIWLKPHLVASTMTQNTEEDYFDSLE